MYKYNILHKHIYSTLYNVHVYPRQLEFTSHLLYMHSSTIYADVQMYMYIHFFVTVSEEVRKSVKCTETELSFLKETNKKYLFLILNYMCNIWQYYAVP